MEKTFLEILMQTIESDSDLLTFLHNTNSEEVAKEIIQNGFKFNSHLDYTTDNVSAKDEVTIKYFTITRQAYGKYTLVIQISKEIIEHYSSILEDTHHHFSEILTIRPPILGPDEEMIYQLAPQFVKAFIYEPNCELMLNPNFDPHYNCEVFKENMQKILSNFKDNGLE